MIDLHTHTFLSDGELLPAEQVRRAQINGYQAIALTDHVDSGNLQSVLTQITKVAEDLNSLKGIKVIPGVEITHVPPPLISDLAKKARELGAKIVVVHGESPVEPVAPETNLFALKSDIDILAHPGLITNEETKLAKERKIHLEISARKGHSLTNGFVVQMARKFGAKLVINTDAHSPRELFTPELLRKVGLGAGLSEDELKQTLNNSLNLVNQKF